METFLKPLTSGEEAKYIRLLRDGNEEEEREAKRVLVEHNLRLVAHIVKKYQGIGDEAEDLLSVGYIGLIKAVDSFDVCKGKLVTYACRCIENELLMFFRSKRKLSREVSLFESIGQDREGNEIRLMDIVEQQQIDVVDDMEKRQNMKRVRELIPICLNKREKQIIELRYGMNGAPEMTQNQIGKLLGISRSYVSRIEKRALEKLRNHF